MNIEQLIDQFELVTDTEEGLEQLRKLILNLAVRGKLTEQDSNDEPAEKLLERINAEKQRLYDDREIRKPKDYSEIEKNKIPFEAHENWKWVKFGSIGITQTGTTPKTSVSKYYGDYIPFLGPGDLSNGEIDYSNRALSEIGLEEGRLIPQNSIVMVCIGGSIGKCNVVDRNVSCNQQINTIYPLCNLNPKLVNEFVKAHFFQSDILNKASGSATPIINKTKWENLPFPLPPLEEQHRIVKKMEALFGRVDELEQKVRQDRQVDERLQGAVLNDLQRAETPEASKQSWQRLTDNFAQIYRKPEHIDQLKQAILNEAVRGGLVPQDPNDEPAKLLLERITREKQRLYEEGEIRKPKELPEITDEEIPYELPVGWVWERFGNLGVINPRNNTENDIEASFIPMKMISENFSYEHEFEVKKWKEIKSGYTHFAEGDIGLAKITPCFENGKAAIFKDLKNGIGAGTTELYIFRPLNDTILNRYAYLYLQTPKFREEGKKKMTGTAGQQRVPKSYFEEALFPLPPFNEQKRIIEKIYYLFAWCDDLKDKLSRSRQTDRRLLEALVNGAGR